MSPAVTVGAVDATRRATRVMPSANSAVRAALPAATPITAAAVTIPKWSPAPMAPVGRAVVSILLSLGGMKVANPSPVNPLQMFLYSLAKSVNDFMDPPPSPGTPTVGTPDLNTGAVSGWTGYPTGAGLTFTVSPAVKGNVTVSGDGTYSYTPTQVARQSANASTTDSFTVTVHEGLSTNSVTVTVPVSPVGQTPPVNPGGGTTPPVGTGGGTTPPTFVGDYSTGDLSQWPGVQVKGYNGPPSSYVPTYSASIVNDSAKGKAARFEVRSGDVPPFGGGERAEVQGPNAAGGTEGQTMWYEFSTKFDPSFPQNHADLAWGVTNQFHSIDANGSPPVGWYVDQRNGYWSLTIHKQSSPGVYLQTFSIFDVPLGTDWHDVKMEIHWSSSDTDGFIRLWLNGVAQTFNNGSQTYYVRTLVPGTAGVYYKEGMYRGPMSAPDIVYHAGFRSATAETGL